MTLKVWGEYAAFHRPEMKVERVSYDVMTPSAARGVLEAIYWKPQFRWVIERIRVLKPIRFTHIRRNEIGAKISARDVRAAMDRGRGGLGLFVEEHRQQRAARILRDVEYVIEAHVEIVDPTEKDGTVLEHPEAKHLEAFKRRAARGQYFHHPYLGCREYPANFELVERAGEKWSCPEELRGTRDLGYMLLDIEYVEDARGQIVESSLGRRLRAEPRFFRARLMDGVLEVPRMLTEAR